METITYFPLDNTSSSIKLTVCKMDNNFDFIYFPKISYLFKDSSSNPVISHVYHGNVAITTHFDNMFG